VPGQRGDRGGPVIGPDERLADEHRLVAGAGQAGRVLRAADTRFGHRDDLGRDRRGQPLGPNAVDRERRQIAPAASARSSSGSSCTSTSASRPTSAAAAAKSASSRSLSAATISRTASAPISRAS
jgi:hypothetical protein